MSPAFLCLKKIFIAQNCIFFTFPFVNELFYCVRLTWQFLMLTSFNIQTQRRQRSLLRHLRIADGFIFHPKTFLMNFLLIRGIFERFGAGKKFHSWFYNWLLELNKNYCQWQFKFHHLIFLIRHDAHNWKIINLLIKSWHPLSITCYA